MNILSLLNRQAPPELANVIAEDIPASKSGNGAKSKWDPREFGPLAPPKSQEEAPDSSRSHEMQIVARTGEDTYGFYIAQKTMEKNRKTATFEPTRSTISMVQRLRELSNATAQKDLGSDG